jgi:F-type H+-transporting ATPase subunit delta
MQALSLLYRQSDVFRHLLVTTRISVDEKLTAVRAAFGKQLGDLEYGVLRQIIERRLGMKLPDIVKAIVSLAKSDDPADELTVYSAEKISAADLDKMARKLEKQLGRPLKESSVVDASLLGGMKLRLGNTLVDGSVASRLEMIRQDLS